MSSLARGDARMRQIGAVNKTRADAIASELLAALARQPTPIDKVMAMTIAAATVRLERQLELGRDTTSARRALREAIAGSPFEPTPREHA